MIVKPTLWDGHMVYFWTPSPDRRASKKQARQHIAPGTPKRQRERRLRHQTRFICSGMAPWPIEDLAEEEMPIKEVEVGEYYHAVHWDAAP